MISNFILLFGKISKQIKQNVVIIGKRMQTLDPLNMYSRNSQYAYKSANAAAFLIKSFLTQSPVNSGERLLFKAAL